MTDAPNRVLYRLFYKTVPGAQVARANFESNKAKGLRPRGPELRDPRLHEAISVMDSLPRAQERARQFPVHGAYIAELRIAPDAPIRLERTLATEGHYSLWGAPEDLLACVVRVIPIEAEGEGQR